MLPSSQAGMDGVGHPKKTEGPAVSLKAKNIQTQKETFLRVTGLKSGATIAIPVIVKPGRGPDFYHHGKYMSHRDQLLDLVCM